MPVDYQPPMDVQTAPPGYYAASPAPAYAGNAAAQRYMAEQAARGYGQADYGQAPVQQVQMQQAPASMPPAALQTIAYQEPAAPSPFPRATYRGRAPVRTQAAVYPQQAAIVPVQYGYPAQPYQAPQYAAPQAAPAYAQPSYQAPAYQAPVYQQAPAYAQPTYQQPAYQQPARAPARAAQPTLTYPTEAYSHQGFGTQTYGSPDYAISPSQGYYQAPRQTYQAPQPVYAPQQAYPQAQTYTAPQGYSTPTYYSAPIVQQPVMQAAPVYAQPTYVTRTTRVTRRAARVARRQQRTAAAVTRRTRAPVYVQQPATTTYTYQQAQAYPAPVQAYPQLNYDSAPQPVYQAPTYQQAPVYAQPQVQPMSLQYAEPTTQQSYAGGDPEMDRINSEIASLSADRSARIEAGIGYRYRDGENGLGRLNEVSGRVAASTGLGGGRVELSVSPVYVDAGTPTGSGLSRFGTNPLPQAQAVAGNFTPVLPAAPGQNDSGVAVRLSYDTGNLTLDGGTTPIGFDKTKFQGGARFAPRLGRDVSGRVFAERRPVTDSVISYAGTVDPATGARWGQVMKTGGGGGLSLDRGQGGGVYGDVNYYHYDGRNVRDNYSVEVNAGGYLTAWRRDTSSITAGVNLNYQHYDNNQNYFSFGHGGYFSPQQYVSIAFPLRYRTISGPLSLDATLTPGFQTYRQNGEAVFPTSDALQAAVLRFRQGNNAVLANYTQTNKSGFGIAFQGVGWYRVAPATSIGGELRLNTFGNYNEAQALLRVRHSLGDLR